MAKVKQRAGWNWLYKDALQETLQELSLGSCSLAGGGMRVKLSKAYDNPDMKVFLCCFHLLSSVTLGKSQSQVTFLSPDYYFLFWNRIHCVLNWGLFPEGIYNPADDLRPTIISQLGNQTSDESPFREEENPRWPLKNASDLRRWGAGRHASLILHWDFQLRLTSQALPGFFFFGQVGTFERWQFKQWFV